MRRRQPQLRLAGKRGNGQHDVTRRAGIRQHRARGGVT